MGERERWREEGDMPREGAVLAMCLVAVEGMLALMRVGEGACVCVCTGDVGCIGVDVGGLDEVLELGICSLHNSEAISQINQLRMKERRGREGPDINEMEGSAWMTAA